MLFTALFLASTAFAGPGCPKAKARLEEFLNGLPTECRQDSECDGYYYRADSQAPPVVLAKPGAPPGSKEEKELLKRQAAVREACADESSNRPASPTPFEAVCRGGRCVDRQGADNEEPQPAPKRRSKGGWKASIKNTCAPWDGAALGITMTRGKAGCEPPKGEHVGVTLWRGLPPRPGKKFDFKDRELGTATRCKAPNDCSAAESGWIEFDRYDPKGGKASGRFELRFEGSIEAGSFDAEWCPGEALCG